ncbi:hypothetical protein J7K06_02845 [Candidatus Bathyarchaeota archaeon]|nr:hypothetical protein [Candidatus Bathyarchaeota archaeon]
METEAPRLVRSGLVLFLSRILSIATGMAFTIMITRNVPVEEYGVWRNINSDIIIYFTLLSAIFPFWIMRFVARGHEGSAKTGVIANLLLGIISSALYVFLIPFILPLLGISMNYLPVYLLASFQIVELYMLSAFQSVLRVVNIESLSYGLLLEEVVRVALAYLFVMQLRMGLQGAMFALICGFLAQTLFFLYMSRKSLKGKIEWEYVKEWTKGSLANLYNIIGQRLATFSFILLIIICGEVGLKARAYYGASSQIATVITYSMYLVFALYPRLLILKNPEDVSESFKLFFMFALPMTAGIFVLADSYLTILGKGKIDGEFVDYSVATPVLRLLAFAMLALSISQVLNSILFGTEKIDLEARIHLKKLVKSKIFVVFTLSYIKAAIILPALLFFLPIFRDDPLTSALYIAVLMFIAEIILLIIRCILVKKTLDFIFPWKNLLKYSFASAIMAVFLLLIDHPTRISTVLLYTVIAGAIYFAILLIIDKDARSLVKEILNEIKLEVNKTKLLRGRPIKT